MFNKRGANIPNIQIRYLGVLIKVVDAIKYLGLIFSGIKKNSPNIENLALAAERTRFAVQNRMNNITGLSPEPAEVCHTDLAWDYLQVNAFIHSFIQVQNLKPDSVID